MTPQDAAKVLLLIQVYDNRQFDEVTAAAWAESLSGLELGDCLDAVKEYFRTAKEWLMPIDIRRLVRAALAARRLVENTQIAIEPSPAADPAVADERARLIREATAHSNQIPPDEPDVPKPPTDPKLEMAARTVPCPWCESPAGEPCINRATNRRSQVTHEARIGVAS